MRPRALHWLLFLVVCLYPVVASAQADRPAEALRAYFAEHGKLVDTNNTTVSVLIREYFAVQTPKTCNIRRVEASPAHLDPGTVGVYMVDMSNAETLCKQAPSAACGAIRRSCVAVDTSIFCDAAFDDAMTLLSEAAHTDLFLWVYAKERDHLETEAERANRKFFFLDSPAALAIPLVLQTDTFSGVARSVAYMETHGRRGDTFAHTIKYMGLCHGRAMAEMPLLMGVYGPVIAHEYGHVEQNACPDGAVPKPVDANEEITRYRKIACSTASDDELLADLRAVELLKDAELRMFFDASKLETGGAAGAMRPGGGSRADILGTRRTDRPAPAQRVPQPLRHGLGSRYGV